MKADTTVKVYRSTDANAPALNGLAGGLVSVLDACLIDGYDPRTISSISVSGGIATAAIPSGNPFSAGAVIKITGVTSTEALNGEWRVASSSASELTFSVAGTGVGDGSATGTITAIRAPANWEVQFTASNKRAYRSKGVESLRPVLRVDDTGTLNARVRGFVSMSDIDTGSDPFPTDAQVSGGGYWAKSFEATATARAWILVADDRTLYLVSFYNSPATTRPLVSFGEFRPTRAADQWAALLECGANSSQASCGPVPAFGASGKFVPRSYTAAPGALNVRTYSHRTQSVGSGRQGIALPDPVSGRFFVAPVEVWEADTTGLRGIIRGFYCSLHLMTTSDPDSAEEVVVDGLPGRTLLRLKVSQNSTLHAAVFDITGPWE